MSEIEKQVADLLQSAIAKERQKVVRESRKVDAAKQRVDQWRARAQMYRTSLLRVTKELAEARRALRKSA